MRAPCSTLISAHRLFYSDAFVSTVGIDVCRNNDRSLWRSERFIATKALVDEEQPVSSGTMLSIVVAVLAILRG